MATIIDSLFLELGIDTSKFSKDQQQALAKIAEFEKRSKKGAKGAAQAVKTVGQAFKDLASDSRIGATANRLDSFAVKFKNLGQAAQVSGGGAGSALGGMVEGLGMLLSPTALGVAALGMLGKAAWDLNAKLTATNATIQRQALLSGMNAKNMLAWGEAAHAVGGSPTDIPTFLTDLNTKLAGGFTGFGNPGPMLTGMALMGIPFSPGQAVDPAALIAGYRRYAQAHGGGTFGWDAARAIAQQTGLFDASLFKFAMPGGGGLTAYNYARSHAPPNINAVIGESLKSQRLLGLKDIREAMIAERAYGALQNPMDKVVGFLTSLLADADGMLRWTIKIAGYVKDLFDFVTHPGKDVKNAVTKTVEKHYQHELVTHGVPPKEAKKEAAADTVATGKAVAEVTKVAVDLASLPIEITDPATVDPAVAKVIQWFKGKPPAPAAEQRAAPARRQARTRQTIESVAPPPLAEQRGAPDTVGPENGTASTDVLLAQKLPQTLKARQLLAMDTLVKLGVSAKNAAAMIGNFSQESLLKPGATSDRGEHVGIGQWDRDRQQSFQQMFGYRMGSREVPQLQQFLQQLLFAEVELWRSQAGTARQMARALGLSGKTRAFEELDERPGDQSFPLRLRYAEKALKDFNNMLQAVTSYTNVTNRINSSTRIGDVHVHTPATDPLAHAKAVRKGLSTQPLLDPNALRSIALSTTSVAG